MEPNSRISKLLIQISNIHMCVVPGPASQDAVIKRKYASPGLQCSFFTHSFYISTSASPITVRFGAILLQPSDGYFQICQSLFPLLHTQDRTVNPQIFTEYCLCKSKRFVHCNSDLLSHSESSCTVETLPEHRTPLLSKDFNKDNLNGQQHEIFGIFLHESILDLKVIPKYFLKFVFSFGQILKKDMNQTTSLLLYCSSSVPENTADAVSVVSLTTLLMLYCISSVPDNTADAVSVVSLTTLLMLYQQCP